MDYKKNSNKTTNKKNLKNTSEDNSIEDIEYVKDDDYIDDTRFIDDVDYIDVDADSMSTDSINSENVNLGKIGSMDTGFSSKRNKPSKKIEDLEKPQDIDVTDDAKNQNRVLKSLDSLKGNYKKSEENIIQLESIRNEQQKNIVGDLNQDAVRTKVNSKNKTEVKAKASLKEKKAVEVQAKVELEDKLAAQEKVEDEKKTVIENKVGTKKIKKKESSINKQKTNSKKELNINNENISNLEKIANKVESADKATTVSGTSHLDEISLADTKYANDKHLKDIGEKINKVSVKTDKTEMNKTEVIKIETDKTGTNEIEATKTEVTKIENDEAGMTKTEVSKTQVSKVNDDIQEMKLDDKQNENIKEKTMDKAKETKKNSKKKSSIKPISFSERMMINDEENTDTEAILSTKEIKLGSSEDDIRMEEYVRPEAKQLKKVIPDERKESVKKQAKKSNKAEADNKNNDEKSSKDTIRIYQKKRADNGTTFVWNDGLNNSVSNHSIPKNHSNTGVDNRYVNNNISNRYVNNININSDTRSLSEDSEIEYAGSNIPKILQLKIANRLFQLVKWILVSIFIGVAVGIVSVAFAHCMSFVTNFRMNNHWIIYFLPIGGIAIVYMYNRLHYKNDKGTNSVIGAIRAEEDIPIKMAPLIFISTIITHLFGGSSGREGAALQLGGSIGNQLGKFINLDEKDRRVVLMSGMSAAFSAIFGTPIAAAVFSMEMASIGIMHYSAFVPCAIASLVASELANALGIHAEFFEVLEIPDLNILIAGKIVLLAICCAAISVIFCMLLHIFSDYSKKIFKNPYVRIVLGALIVLGLTLLLNTRDYMGAGINIIEEAMKGQVKPEAFALKMLFTVITLGVGYKGGEIVPSFFIGATFGCLFGQILNFSPSFCAALGMVAVFCGVTNCPITSLLISFELFGYKGVYYFLLTIPISYMMSGYSSLYKNQKIMYSKFKTQYINRSTSK